jgi:hypothetical protein
MPMIQILEIQSNSHKEPKANHPDCRNVLPNIEY